jgi:DNA-binding PadR family transcriptional regulator
MFKVKIGGERLNPHQIAILLKLRSGEEKASNLLREMYKFGFESKSSFYTSLTELKERGYIEVDEDGWVKLTEKGVEALSKIPNLIEPKIKSIMKYISFIMESSKPRGEERYVSIVEEIEDVNELEEYKKFLEEELRKVKDKLKGWRRVEVE